MFSAVRAARVHYRQKYGDEGLEIIDDVIRAREVVPSVAVAYGWGYCGTGPYQGRLVVPVDWNDVLVNWVARDIGKARKTSSY